MLQDIIPIEHINLMIILLTAIVFLFKDRFWYPFMVEWLCVDETMLRFRMILNMTDLIYNDCTIRSVDKHIALYPRRIIERIKL